MWKQETFIIFSQRKIPELDSNSQTEISRETI